MARAASCLQGRKRPFSAADFGVDLKQHTIIFVPHARARFRKWRVSNRQLTVVATLLLLLAGGSIFTTWSFFTNTVDLKELDEVRFENEELRQVNQSFEDSIRSLQHQLGEFENRTRQLAIVAGLEGLSGGREAGIGGGSLSTLSQPTEAEELSSLRSRATSLVSDLQLVESELDERDRLIRSTPAITPVRGILTSGFGYRKDPISGLRALHQGIDLSTSPGRPVLATADGIVVRAGRVGSLGNAVYLSHGYGMTTRYGHLSKISVQPGDRVAQGDTLGLVGSTGKATGYHLHYEVRRDGKSVNPWAYILEDPTEGL